MRPVSLHGLLLLLLLAATVAACSAPSAPDAGPSMDAAEDAGPEPDCRTDEDCDDADGCTLDRCVEGGCGHLQDPECMRCESAADCAGVVTPGPCGLVMCADGACARVPNPEREGMPCDDDDLCTRFDRCNGAECVGDPVECSSGDPCLDGSACDPATGECTTGAPRPEGAPCNADDDGCTMGDSCQGGVCRAGAPVRCDDGVSCSADTCVSTGPGAFECLAAPAPGTCLIDGMCWSDRERRPGSQCELCDTDAATDAWSSEIGLSCSDGDACTDADACDGSGACVGTPRTDSFERNDTRTAAAPLGTVSDRAAWPAGTFQASLYPTGDEDWFRFRVTDDVGGTVEPRVELSAVPPANDYDLCVYWDCDGADLGVTCREGSPSSFGGLSGCCSFRGASASDEVRLSPECVGGSETGTAYVRVERFSGPWTCDAFTIRWGDD